MTIQALDFSLARQRPADYLNICQTIADSYPLGIAHGIQKDATQNGMDDVVGSQKLKFTFEKTETSKGCFFTMTDTNTCGLTGPVLQIEEYERELGNEAHWARFESFAFTKSDPDAIGARGQGKFVFLAGSKQGRMFYDSLRKDGTYRLGVTQATHTGCPMLHWDENEARKILKEQTGLMPLTEIGTRIIIVDPITELLEELKESSFTHDIQETWFRAIEKGNAEIHVKIDSDDRLVEVPSPFPVPTRDSESFITWIKNDDYIEPTRGEKYRIKHLYIARKRSGRVPEHLRGVAIIHNNMKITSIPMDWAPPNINESIFGFVEFDRELNRELRKNTNQCPNHYDLRWRRIIPRAIKAYVQEQLKEFGIQKLGIGIDPRERKRQLQNAAEEWAIKNLARFAHELDLFGGKRGSILPPSPTPPPQTKIRGVILRDFIFPFHERAPRVNWGESINGFKISIFNKSGVPFSGHLKVFLLFGNRVVMEIEEKKRLKVPGKGELGQFGPYKIDFKQEMFPDPGIYKLRVKLIDETDRSEIDILTRKIYLEKDPDFRAPFEVQACAGFNDPYEKRQWMTQGELGHNSVLLYNVSHPAYAYVEEDESEQGCYLFDIFLEGSMAFILNRPDRSDGSSDFHPLNKERIQGDPKDAYDEVVHKISEIKARLYGEI